MKTVRQAGQLAGTAGLIWLLLWFHQSQTHGFTEVNEKRLLLGATWMDSGKFYVAFFLLLFPCVAYLFSAKSNRTLFAKTAFAVVIGALTLLAVGTAIQFWPFPFGSYRLSFEDSSLTRTGGLVQSLATLVFAVSLIPFGWGLVRDRVVPWWFVPITVVAVISGFFLTPANFIPGLGWLIVGLTLWFRKGHSSKNTD